MTKEKPYSLDAYIESFDKEQANDMIERLYSGDFHIFIEIAENTLHPGLALVVLAEKAEKKPYQNMPIPTEEEVVLLATNFSPTIRFLDVACYIAATPELKNEFLKMAGPVKKATEERIMDNKIQIIQATVISGLNEKYKN